MHNAAVLPTGPMNQASLEASGGQSGDQRLPASVTCRGSEVMSVMVLARPAEFSNIMRRLPRTKENNLTHFPSAASRSKCQSDPKSP